MKFSTALLLFLCLCFWGLTSSELGSSCYSSPCKNGGTCEDAEGSYRCLCPQNPLAYVGWNCEFLYEACGGHACPSELICSGTPGQLNYTCLCRPGQIGLGCNSEADMCETNTCPQPHFECITINNGYGCQCRNRESCQIQSSLCSSNPCHNNGTCTESAGQYICKCQLGHVGTHCEEDVDECASSPCQNGAICLDRVNEYSCFCVPGFQGHHCEIDINECASRPCQHNSTCLNQMDHYVCQCLPGYTGMNCDVEIDECISDPCWNGGTCNDHIGLFTCSCMPGFEGVQCEKDINECQSHPCLNGGMCHDLVNSYFCDCHNTGFEGEHCELDILECASQPCQNGATCLEGVGRYSCDCWSGYVGKHCEEDVNECTMEPCFNGGQCYEKSNQSYYGELTDFPAQFSYQEAAGFICRCQPGFAGDICTVNIDECESQPCQNGGSCMDLVNSYRCQCVPGYSGVDCAIEINECEDHPCENGGACEDGIADYICHCIPGQGGITWGGKNCSVELTGCQAHHCQNEALCVPTYQSETHGYLCQCQAGFYGSTCSISTTFSFSSSTYLFISLSADNRSSSDTSRGDLCAVALRFRTTLPDAILIHRGHKEEHLLLELSGGLVRVTLMMQDAVSSLTLEAPRVDDGFWHNVEVRLQGSLELRLWHEDCHASICWQSCPLAESFSNSLLFSSEIYIGGTDVQLMTNSMQSFIGCLEDLYIDSKVVLPQEMIGTQSSGVQLGCERTDWCHTQPCSHGGQCIDLWADYYCDCSRPYEGHTCSFESPTATFGLENSLSFATFAISNSPGANFNLSFFIRTLKPMGLVFHINNGTETLLAVYLMDGQLQIEASTAAPISISGHLADGRRHFVMLSFHEGFVYASLLNRGEHLGPLKVTPLAAGSEIHVGGFLDEDSISLWGGYFKGCLQDIRLNHHQMQFFGPEGDRPEELFVEQKTNVFLGCISDDTCKPEPCFNGGHCTVTWNDFICSCTANFTGKSCEERVWCESEPCSQATTCVDVPSGYVCLSNATFHGHDAVEFTTNASITRALHSLRLDFRTRDEDAVLLRVVQEVDSLLVAVQNSSLLVEIRSGNGIEGVNFLSQMSISDGSWHMLVLSMEEPSALSSRWHLYLDGSMNTTLQGHAGSLDFVKNNAIIILAENFTGCLGHADIGGVFLPLAAHNSYPQPEQFLQLGNKAPLLGCKGANVCASSPCHHAGSCQDLFNAFRCVCTAGWEGLLCEANIDDCNSSPCIHGKCVDEVADFQCECDKGYIGKRCHINVDDCIRHQCQNGGTCVDGVYSYTCTCPPQYTGPHCEWPFPPEHCGKNFTCLNGGTCTSGSWGANCTCKPGYAGRKCQININECDPNPCQNGGTCQDSINRYRCVCSASYTGERCDVDRGTPSAFSPFPLIEVAVPVACGCLLLLIIILILMILTARKRRQSEGTYSPSQQEVAGARLEMDSVLKQPAWAQISSSTLVGAVGAAGAAVLITIFGISVIAMKKRRATQGTYSPSRQEKDGARVEMWNVIKLPPMERLI